MSTHRAPLLGLLILLLVHTAGIQCALAQDTAGEWPRAITVDGWVVTIYQPQIESFAGTTLEGRAAVSVRKADGTTEPVFGAVWITTTVEIDRDARTVRVRAASVPSVKFVDSEQADRDRLAALLEREIPGWDLVFDLDMLIAALDGSDGLATTPGLRNDPPVFVLSKEPAVLLLFDGEPRLQEIPQSGGVERVVNTPFPVLRDSSGSYFLYGGPAYWYVAKEAAGPWRHTGDVPTAVSKLVEDIAPPEGFADDTEAEAETGEEIPPPAIIVATEPTELIVTQGEPRWTPVASLDLLYLDNTDSDVFLDITTQLYYVLVSGRWYAGSAVADRFEWTHVPNDQLPEAFSDLEPDGVNGHVLAHISGTEQAREEALNNAIPQTAAVKRDDTSYSVKYDGEPEFQQVEGAEGVMAAVNSAADVFLVEGAYWACDNAIWYTAPAATGPWTVATEIPVAIYSIPASSPHHTVTYVHVYETTPTVVYVGYTPGYIGSYWYRGCVVWGTGWRYSPWYGPYYYPRPWTWGLNVHYNPWYGWSFGVTWSRGPFSVSLWSGGSYGSRYGYGWYGHGGYRPPYYRPYPPPHYSKPRPTPYGTGGTTRPGDMRPQTLPSANIYDRPATRDRVESTRPVGGKPRPEHMNAPNDVLTDRAGNVYRPGSDGGWERRENGQWKPADGLDRPSTQPATPSTRPSTRPDTQPGTRPATPSASGTRPVTPSVPSTRPSHPSGGSTRPQLERDSRSRQRGSQRMQSRPPSAGRGSMGGSRGRRR